MNAYAVCSLNAIAVRSQPSQRSEMISQLLFGELAEVMEIKGQAWSRIRCEWDNTVGWAASNQLMPITPAEYESYQQSFALSLELFQAVTASDHFLPVSMGARFPGFDGIRFCLGERDYTFSGQVIFPGPEVQTRDMVVKLARRFLHTPFLWGGRSPLGVDGAGLVQAVFRLCGIRLPRHAEQQVFEGDVVDFIEQAHPGDIAFFENNFGRVFHTGILLNDNQIIHAFGKVRIDMLDHYGIYDLERRKYSHRLRVIKSFLPASNLPKTASDAEKMASSNSQMALFEQINL